MDPLTALREFTTKNTLDTIQKQNDVFNFNNLYTFPCKTETTYKSKQGNFYTLETLVFFVKNRHIKQPEYIKAATQTGVPSVTWVDRRPLLDFLEGRNNTDNTDNSNNNVPSSVPLLSPDHPTELSPDLNNNIDDSNTEIDVMSMIRNGEKPIRDRNVILQCRNRDLYGVYTGAVKRDQEKVKEVTVGPTSGTKRGGGGERERERGEREREEYMPKAKVMKGVSGGGKGGEGVPIILVPSASNTLITMYNVKEFLEDGVFVSTEVKMKSMKGVKPECVTVQKKFSRDKDKVMTAYEVRDKPSSLRSDDWERVVAVFVLGKEWQFKDWPFKDHVEIFNKILGFFMRFEDDSIESAKIVKQWNVKIISISKNKRHQDRAAALEVWGKLEEFVARSRS